MVTQLTWELTAEERHQLARELMPEILAELEKALLELQEKKGLSEGEEVKKLIWQTLLDVIREIEPQFPEPDEGLTLRPEVIREIRAAHDQPTVSLGTKQESGMDDLSDDMLWDSLRMPKII